LNFRASLDLFEDRYLNHISSSTVAVRHVRDKISQIYYSAVENKVGVPLGLMKGSVG